MISGIGRKPLTNHLKIKDGKMCEGIISKDEIIKRKEYSLAIYSGVDTSDKEEYKGERYYYSTYGAAKEIIYLCGIILKLLKHMEKKNETNKEASIG